MLCIRPLYLENFLRPLGEGASLAHVTVWCQLIRLETDLVNVSVGYRLGKTFKSAEVLHPNGYKVYVSFV
jgi:hypothetical protein